MTTVFSRMPRVAGGAQGLRALGLAAAAIAVVALASTPAAAQSTDAPHTTLSPDGLTVTDGTHVLRVSKAAGLDPNGEAVRVDGSGYDLNKGIYLTFCVLPAYNQPPSPCGGGPGDDGGGSSHWISSNPPPYGVGVAVPYGPGGSFSLTVTPQAMIGTVDCRQVRCGIVTRNDHTRTTDRSQDLFIPVTFAATPVTSPPPPTTPPSTTSTPGQPTPSALGAPTSTTGTPSGPTTVAPGSTATTTTTAAISSDAAPPPAVTLSADGRSATDGTRTLSLSAVESLSVDGERLRVEGHGFDTTKGVEVALCRVIDDQPPAPCAEPTVTAGPAKTWAWISDTAPTARPDGIVATPVPYADGGAFEVTITAEPIIDDATDCRQVACAVVTRPDFQRPEDRSQELAVPVTFTDTRDVTSAAETDTTTTNANEEAAAVGLASIDEPTSGVAGVVAAAGAVLAVGGIVAAARGTRRRRQEAVQS